MTTRDGDAPDAPARKATRRGSRFWLFAPFVLLALVVIGWSAAWFAIRERVVVELDGLLGVEETLGRSWTCADRRVAGFPFRIEVSCGRLALATADGLTLDLGPAQALAQIYQPRHAIVNVAGPLGVETPEGRVAAQWELLEASVRNLGRGTEQLAIVVEAPRATISAPALPAPVEANAARAELYARPSPGTTLATGALDAVMRAEALEVPGLAVALPEAARGPADIEVQLRLHAPRALARGGDDPALAARAWRDAGGRLEIGVVAVETGSAALQLSGELALDAMDRPEGRIEASGRGLGPIVQAALGGRGDFMVDAIVAALGGDAPPAADGEPAPELRPLPPLRIAEGRVFVGPIPVPRVSVPPLF
ncbi:DUF2125 domain-containing protein [Salinarimonas ramus]|uniref:DUF2125 domain-containing protein n=1 Tax=Salinarimonas ramus TaxID=690164 RepID=A0A917V3U9_9HYPH|nr:DUF2125 domain-containing protein [Salinarimonas ramus]GGK33490.1 hypothetical protein GCM10011322_20180 [Salinarimonas ramus]